MFVCEEVHTMASKIGFTLLRIYRLALAPLLTILATTAVAALAFHLYFESQNPCLDGCPNICMSGSMSACPSILATLAERWLPLPIFDLFVYPNEATIVLAVMIVLVVVGLRFALQTRTTAADRWTDLATLCTTEPDRWHATLLNTFACTCLVLALILVSISSPFDLASMLRSVSNSFSFAGYLLL
jgi:hypothetical protein